MGCVTSYDVAIPIEAKDPLLLLDCWDYPVGTEITVASANLSHLLYCHTPATEKDDFLITTKVTDNDANGIILERIIQRHKREGPKKREKEKENEKKDDNKNNKSTGKLTKKESERKSKDKMEREKKEREAKEKAEKEREREKKKKKGKKGAKKEPLHPSELPDLGRDEALIEIKKVQPEDLGREPVTVDGKSYNCRVTMYKSSPTTKRMVWTSQSCPMPLQIRMEVDQDKVVRRKLNSVHPVSGAIIQLTALSIEAKAGEIHGQSVSMYPYTIEHSPQSAGLLHVSVNCSVDAITPGTMHRSGFTFTVIVHKARQLVNPPKPENEKAKEKDKKGNIPPSPGTVSQRSASQNKMRRNSTRKGSMSRRASVKGSMKNMSPKSTAKMSPKSPAPPLARQTSAFGSGSFKEETVGPCWCVVSFHDKKATTTEMDGPNPEWEETFSFQLSAQVKVPELVLEVFNATGLLGRCVLYLREYDFRDGEVLQWMPLTRSVKNDQQKLLMCYLTPELPGWGGVILPRGLKPEQLYKFSKSPEWLTSTRRDFHEKAYSFVAAMDIPKKQFVKSYATQSEGDAVQEAVGKRWDLSQSTMYQRHSKVSDDVSVNDMDEGFGIVPR